MVRLINKDNLDTISNIVYSILRLQEKFTRIVEYNNPGFKSCIYAMWHANQMLVHGIRDRSNVNILISNSIDGEIVARTSENWGFKVIRGSSGKKGAVESTMHMISALNAGESIAIMVDGPHGPLHKIKNGALKLAQKTGVPIIPSFWYSPQKTFVSLPSWDKMKVPVGICNILNTYGNPIYISKNASDDEINIAKQNLENQLLTLENNAPEIYKEAIKNNLWKK